MVKGPRKGEACGKPAKVNGWCVNHGPGGENEQRRQRNQEARGECLEIIRKGPRQGEVCGRDVLPGKSVCYMHDPDRTAKILSPDRKNPCKGQRASGEPCPLSAMPGLDVCAQHGGRTQASKAKSARFTAAQEMRKVLTKLGVDVSVVVNPYVALQHHAAQRVAWRDYCLKKVMDLEASQWRYESQQGLEQVRGEIQIYQDAAKDATTALTALARQQNDDHLMAIKTGTYLMLTGALHGSLADAGLDTATIAAVKAEFAKRVRILNGTEIIDGTKMIESAGDGEDGEAV